MKYTALILLTLGLFSMQTSGQALTERAKTVPDAKKFTATYDKFKDETVIGTHLMFRYPKAKAASVECALRTIVSGETLTKPPVTFYFICHNKYILADWRFMEHYRLIFLLDGHDRLEVGDDRSDGVVDSDGWVAYTMFRADLQKLSTAQKIEMQVGSFAGEIEKDSQPRIKTMLDLTAQ